MDTGELLKEILRVPGPAGFGRVRYVGTLMGEEEQAEFLKGLVVKAVEAREADDLDLLAEYLEEWERKAMATLAARARLPFEMDTAPWTPLRVPVRQARFALVTTGGIYVEGQEPYETDGPEGQGDITFRAIPKDVPRDQIRIAHRHYDVRGPREDINCVFPLDRFADLEREGAIGALADTCYSFMGYIQTPERLMAETAPEAARLLKADGVDAVVLTST
jgi:D-proline reductase (dithiol) PrdB